MLKSFLNFCPLYVVLILVVCSYYTYVVQFCTLLLTGLLQKILYLIFYHILMLLFLWAFIQSICCSHDPIPDEYHLGSSEHNRLLTYEEAEADQILRKIINVRRLEIYTCTPSGRIRYCKYCMLIKPDRTHHCSTCKKCILKMDHHCPWISNCVGFSNYKQFYLMLLYGTVWCVFMVATIAEYVAEIWKDFQNNLSKLFIGIGFIVAAFMGMLLGILWFYHCGLVCRNETTLEALRDLTFREDNVTFDLGRWYNWEDVFGENICCWLLPLQTARGNGYEFQVNSLTV